MINYILYYVLNYQSKYGSGSALVRKGVTTTTTTDKSEALKRELSKLALKKDLGSLCGVIKFVLVQKKVHNEVGVNYGTICGHS